MMASDPIAEALVSLAGGFITSLLTVISIRTLPALGAPPGVYYSVALISLVTLTLVSFGASALCFIYVLFMFFHGYFFVDAGFITIGMATSVALVGATILKSVFVKRAAEIKKRHARPSPDMR